MLIINADDLGLSRQVNLAIIHALTRGFCSSCSIMPNMPGFEEACELVQRHGLTDRVGLHLTLTEGTPVTEPIKKVGIFCGRNGCFHLSRKQRVVRLSAAVKRAVREEIEGQIARCRERGIEITHLDSHSHAHEEWAVAPVVLQAAREAGIPRVRVCRTFGGGISPVKWLYRRVVNLKIRAAGLAATDYFGVPDDYLLFCRKYGTLERASTSWEIMVHPIRIGERLFDSWLGRPLEDVISALSVRGGGLGRAEPRNEAVS